MTVEMFKNLYVNSANKLSGTMDFLWRLSSELFRKSLNSFYNNINYEYHAISATVQRLSMMNEFLFPRTPDDDENYFFGPNIHTLNIFHLIFFFLGVVILSSTHSWLNKVN